MISINGFEPQIYGKDKMEMAYTDTISYQEQELSTVLAKHIYDMYIPKLEESIRRKEGDMILVKFDLDTLKSRFIFNTNLFVEFAVRREFMKISEANKMKTYPLDRHTLILTY